MATVRQGQLVLVSGAPGSGKTTLAVPLARALGFALLSKDEIKETLYDTLGGPPGDLAYSRRIGGAAMELLWTLARRCPRVVLEANFRPHSAYERSRLRGLGSDVVEVHCRCAPGLAARRFAERAARPGHHPAHVLAELSPEMMAEYDGPIGLGTVVDVDTTQPVDIERLAERIRTLFFIA